MCACLLFPASRLSTILINHHAVYLHHGNVGPVVQSAEIDELLECVTELQKPAAERRQWPADTKWRLSAIEWYGDSVFFSKLRVFFLVWVAYFSSMSRDVYAGAL